MRAWWERLRPRERRLVGAAVLVVAAVVAWTMVWEPLRDARRSAAEQVAAQRALLDWLDRMAPQVRQMRRAERLAGTATADDRSTLAIIDETARAAGLAGALKRIEPGSGDEVRVDLAGAAFPDLMGWLSGLVVEQPMTVVRMTADRSAPGRVDSVVVLRRGTAGP
jgi:general secretion pathway protein M